MDDIAKLLIALGIGITLVGGLLFVFARVFGGERLPGDFVFQSGNMTCLVPIASSIILSIVLTILFNIIIRINPK
jgi:hypothetical protein